MSEQTQAQQTIEPHQAAVERLLAEAAATGNDFDRLTFLSRCRGTLRGECEDAAEQLLKTHRGKLDSVTWDVDFEYDDEGGTFPSISGITLHLDDDREIPLGDPWLNFRDDGAIDDFLALDYPEAKALAETLEQEDSDANTEFTAVIAGMTGIPADRIDDYLGVLIDHINENPRDESLTLGPAAPQKDGQHA